MVSPSVVGEDYAVMDEPVYASMPSFPRARRLIDVARMAFAWLALQDLLTSRFVIYVQTSMHDALDTEQY